MPRIVIRADGDSGREAGMGHIYRSLAYVQALRERHPGIDFVYLMRDLPEGIVKVAGEGHRVVKLPVRPTGGDYRTALSALEPDLIIVDTPGSTPELMAACRASARKVITIDDIEPSALSADVVLNGIIWSTRRWNHPAPPPKVYEGVEYLPLRPQFAEAHKRRRTVSPDVRELLTCTGGSDLRDFAGSFMRAAARLSFPCHMSVMIGPAYPEISGLRRLAAELSGSVRFSLVQGADNMSDYLLKADLALITGGTVMYECAACGTPAIVVPSHAHQAPQAAELAARGIAADLGFSAAPMDTVRLAETIEELATDYPRRARMSQLGREWVDGGGFERFLDIVWTELTDATG